MVSIIVPSYNREKTIKRCIESLLNQTYQDFEIIIVDDASVDNTEAVVRQCNDSRIRYIRLEKNSGACRARNTGIEAAHGEYIAFQDSDDEWIITKLEKQLQFLETHKSEITYCGYTRIREKTGEKEIFPRTTPTTQENKEETFYRLLRENTCSTQTILCKGYCAKDIRFDESLPRLQDWDWILRVSQKYKIVYLDQPLVNAYIQTDSITTFHKKYVTAISIMYNKYSYYINSRREIRYCWIGHFVDAEFGLGNRVTKQCFKAFWGTRKIKYLVKAGICLINQQERFAH